MAHYAFLDDDGFVINVIVGKDENEDGVNWEEWYSQFVGKTCKRTSYNTIGGIHKNGGTPFRKNFAGVGYKYDSVLDGFIPPKPSEKHILDSETCLWKINKKLGIIEENKNSIKSNNQDFITIFIIGGLPNSLETILVNGEKIQGQTDSDGYYDFKLNSDTTGIINITWDDLSLEVISYDY